MFCLSLYRGGCRGRSIVCCSTAGVDAENPRDRRTGCTTILCSCHRPGNRSSREVKQVAGPSPYAAQRYRQNTLPAHHNRHHDVHSIGKAYLWQRFADEQYSLNAALFLANKRRNIERGMAWCLNFSCHAPRSSGLRIMHKVRSRSCVYRIFIHGSSTQRFRM